MRGAVAAAECLRFLLGASRLGVPAPTKGVSSLPGFIFEFLLTVALVTVTIGTASGQNNVGPNAAIARGGYIIAAGLWADSIAGASMNPARSIAPALMSGDWSFLWPYVFGPLSGGIVAVRFAFIHVAQSSCGGPAVQCPDEQWRLAWSDTGAMPGTRYLNSVSTNVTLAPTIKMRSYFTTGSTHET